MKKIFSLLFLVTSVLFITACVEVRNTPPALTGVVAEVTIDFGDTFDPRAGITAYDEQDKDLTSAIELVGYNPAWLEDSRGGIYSYTVYVEDAEGLKVHLSLFNSPLLVLLNKQYHYSMFKKLKHTMLDQELIIH
jgi:hypothetical protein